MTESHTMNAAPTSIIGRPISRTEDFRFVRGAGQFVDDLKRGEMLHAVVLRSSVAHGLLRKLDVSAARSMSGVHAVITAAEIGTTIPMIPLRLAIMPEY